MKEPTESALGCLVDRVFGAAASKRAAARDAEYDQAIERVRLRLPALAERVERNRERVADRVAELIDQPEEQRSAVFAGSSPAMLMTLAFDLMRRSHACRFEDTGSALRYAELAHEAARALAGCGEYSPATGSDLLAEALCHLGNARRLNSDLIGAQQALAEAGRQLASGTRDRQLHARLLSVLASLRHTEGRAREAAALHEREIALRKLIGDPPALGVALIDRGLIACWTGEPLTVACRFVREGIELVESERMIFLGVLHLAEALAREGDGARSLELLDAGRVTAASAELGDGFLRRHRWVQGIASRLVGETGVAKRLLCSVRDEFLERDQPLLAAHVALDLLAVLAARGERRALVELAETAYRAFTAERLENQALSVVLILERAAAADRLTEELAVRAANFVARYQHDRQARF